MRDGLSETERLVLRILADGPLAAGRVFHELQLREALPWLGDIMLAAILARMKQAREPAIASPDMSPAPWPRAILAITAAGRAVLAGRRDYRDLGPPARWLGGVHIPAAACWHWDDAAGTAIWA